MKRLVMIGLFALLGLGTAVADELRVPVGQQAPDKQFIEKPKRGISKEQVAKQFGEPLTKVPAVGEPPISSWEYENYIVFFEHNLALHTVLKSNAKPVE